MPQGVAFATHDPRHRLGEPDALRAAPDLSARLDDALRLHRAGRQQQALQTVSLLAEDARRRDDLPLILLLKLIWLRKCIVVAMQ